MRNEHAARELPKPTDPPMGYGYRQDKETGRVYALRWGQSGRITGALAVPPENWERPEGGDYRVDPSALEWSEHGADHPDTLAWAAGRRWDVRLPQ